MIRLRMIKDERLGKEGRGVEASRSSPSPSRPKGEVADHYSKR